jgi:cytochrome P450
MMEKAALRTIKSLPGPIAWPLIGNVLGLRAGRLHQGFEQMAKLYGPMFRSHFGKKVVLFVAKHETVNAILKERPNVFRRPSAIAKIAAEMGGEVGLFTAEGAQWRDQRRMVMAGFAPNAIKAYFPTLIKVVLRLEQRWAKAATSGAVIDLSADLKRYTVDVIAGLAFGTDVNTLETDENALQQCIDDILPAMSRRGFSLFPYWRWVKFAQDKRLDRSLIALRSEVIGLIALARGRLDSHPELKNKPSNLLEAMIVAADAPDSGMTDEAVVGNVSTMLIAGEDTTAHSIAWLLQLLHQHPKCLALAVAESVRLAAEPSQYTIEAMDNMVYLEACISESMRLKPVAPFISLEAVQNTTIDDVAVPKGTTILCLLRYDSVSDMHFKEAATFNPERWLATSAEIDKRISIPFGSGPRTCPGRYLALLEIKLAVAMLLSRFTLQSVETSDGKAVQEHFGFVMSPQNLRLSLSMAQR